MGGPKGLPMTEIKLRLVRQYAAHPLASQEIFVAKGIFSGRLSAEETVFAIVSFASRPETCIRCEGQRRREDRMPQFVTARVSGVVSCLAGMLAALPLLAAEAPAPSAVEYVDGSVAQSLTGQPGNADEGFKIMSTNALGNCVACHQVSAMKDVDFQGNIGPSLDGVAGRYDEAHLRGIVMDAKRTFEGSMMPSFYKTEGYNRPGAAYTGKAPEGDLPPILNAQQIEDVVAYLLTLK